MKLYIIMVDLDKARDSRYDDRLEKKVCMKAKSIIVQTEQMKEYMLTGGYASEKQQTFLCSHFWPILTDLRPKGETLFGNSIAFSGNLHKAPFSSKLTTLDSRLQFTVDPEFRMITEDWGLVWDGNSLETCDGRFGNYMKMVYPYKASLYLVSNRPIIVWNQCAIADFVTKNHIGITVSNLHEIYDAIHSLSDKDKEMMLENVKKWNKLIRTGEERIEKMKLMIKCQ